MNRYIKRFIGIGFDSRFVTPFVEGGFFKGGKHFQNTKTSSILNFF